MNRHSKLIKVEKKANQQLKLLLLSFLEMDDKGNGLLVTKEGRLIMDYTE